MTLKVCHNMKTEVKHIRGEMGKMKLKRELERIYETYTPFKQA